MRMLSSLGVTATLTWAAGCHPAIDGKFAAPVLTLRGTVSESVPSNFVCSDLAEPRIQGRELTIELPGNYWVESEQTLKVDVRKASGGQFFDYHALVGPTTPGRAAYWRLKNSDPSVEMAAGWTIVWGRKPRAETTWVTTIAEGTTIVAEIADSVTQRVYLIRGTEATVQCKRASNSITMTAEGQYVEIGPDCTLSASPANISADPARQAFIDRLQAMAQSCGWNE